MTAQPDVDIEVPADDLLACLKKVTVLNAMIRRGLAEAERGTGEPGDERGRGPEYY